MKFTPEHTQIADTVRKFVAKEINPYIAQWEKDQQFPAHEVFKKLGNLGLLGRLWWRIPESDDSDDNPTISDYYGWGDISAIYKWRGQSFSGTIRGNPSTGRGAGQLAWTTQPLLGPLRGYVKVFSGYGESLIDYNWSQTTFGIGITLNDWL